MNGSAALYFHRHLTIMLSVRQGGLFSIKRNFYQTALKPCFTTTKVIDFSTNPMVKKLVRNNATFMLPAKPPFPLPAPPARSARCIGLPCQLETPNEEISQPSP